MSFLPPRGMQTSIYPTADSISAVASWVAGSSSTQPSSHPALAMTLLISATIALLESSASRPPLSTQALPLLKQSEKTSKATLGRASNTMPITPKGTLTFFSSNPLGRVFSLITLPSGEGRAATLRISEAMSSKRFGVSCRRS